MSQCILHLIKTYHSFKSWKDFGINFFKFIEIGIFAIRAADSSPHDICTDAIAYGSHFVYEPPNAFLTPSLSVNLLLEILRRGFDGWQF